MARTQLDEAPELTAADVVHSRLSALPGDSTVADVRAWFAASTHRRLAVLAAEDGRYAGSLTPEDVQGDLDPARPAADVARREPTVAPDDPATRAREVALEAPARRVAVVAGDGRLVGVVAITPDLQSFCGTGGSAGS